MLENYPSNTEYQSLVAMYTPKSLDTKMNWQTK